MSSEREGERGGEGGWGAERGAGRRLNFYNRARTRINLTYLELYLS